MNSNYGGKQPRFGGKQPRGKVVDSDDDDDEFDNNNSDKEDQMNDGDNQQDIEDVDEEEEDDFEEDDEEDDDDWGKTKGKKGKGKKKLKKNTSNKKTKTSGKKRTRETTTLSSDESDLDNNDAVVDDEEEEEEDEDFNPERLYKNKADRKKLEEMNEIDREEILAERHEARLKELRKKKNIRELRKKKELAMQKKKEEEAGDGRARKSSRKTAIDKPSNRRATSSEELRAQKAKKSLADMVKKKEQTSKKKKAQVSSEDEDDDDEDDDEEEDDYEDDDETKKKAQYLEDDDESEGMSDSEGEQPASRSNQDWRRTAEEWPDKEHGGLAVEDINLIRIPRSFLEKHLEEPYLESAIKGCMIRFLIGDYQGEAVYRLCEIRGIQPAPKPYRLPGSDKGTANIILKVKHGAHESTARVDKVSNHRLNESELNKWVVAMRDGRQPTLTPAECKRRHDRLKEITTNHTYTTEEVREMVKRRTKAAVASGKQNIAQFRLELMNDIEVKKSKLEAAQSKLDRLRSNPAASSAQMEHVEDEVASLEKALLALEEDRRQIDLHAAKSAMKYNAADKLGNVNDRNRSRNVVVDGEDSRLTLQEEFMGTGDSRNDIFRKQRTKINDLWKTTDKNKSKSGAKGEEDHHAEVVSKVFRNSSLRDKGQKATVKASDMKKSITGLMRSSSDQPRKRIGISLQAYLEKARSSQQQNQ